MHFMLRKTNDNHKLYATNHKMGKLFISLFLLFIIFPAQSEDKLKLIFKCKDDRFNFEIIQNDITKVKIGDLEIVSHASKHDTGQKTYEWGLVNKSSGVLQRFFYIIDENRLVIFKINLNKEQLDLIYKKTEQDKIGKELEKLKAKFFYDEYRKGEKIEKLGEVECKLSGRKR